MSLHKKEQPAPQADDSNEATKHYDAAVVARARDALYESPEQIGPYRILERIGGGGMGDVYRAEQREGVRREVAIKLIRPGFDTRNVIARFEAERQALAMMHHPHIAQVYAAGNDDTGRPYFVMEYVPGKPVTQFADENKLTVRQRLELFLQICGAISHAHTKLIIHRDIKTSNVMAYFDDQKQPVVKVIDFGVAKALSGKSLSDATLYTAHGEILGTYDSMSPEQAAGSSDIDTRTDVYSLGVLLYELLTGAKPFDYAREADHEIRRIIRDVEPPPPSTRLSSLGEAGERIAAARRSQLEALAKELSSELEWIPLMAMRKERDRRYESPAALAADVERYIAGEPLVAGPESFAYRVKKYILRRKGALAATTAIVLLLVGGTIISSLFAVRARRAELLVLDQITEVQSQKVAVEREKSEAERQRNAANAAARQARHESARTQAEYLMEQNLLDQALVHAKEAYTLVGGWEDGVLIGRIVAACRKTWELEHVIEVPERPQAAAIADSKETSYLVLAFGSSVAEIDLSTRKVVKQAAFARTATRLLPFRGNSDRVIVVRQRSIAALSLSDLSVIADHDFGDANVVGVDVGDSELAVTLSNKDIVVFDKNLNVVDTKRWPSESELGVNTELERLAISRDGRWVFAGGRSVSRDCLIWDRSAKSTHLQHLPGNVLRFLDEKTLVGFEPFIESGIAVSTLELTEGETVVKPTDRGYMPWQDMGRPIYVVANKSGLHLAGEFGVGDFIWGLARNSMPRSVVERYASIIGEPAPRVSALCLSGDGSRLVILNQNSVSVFVRHESQFVFSNKTYGMNSCLGSTGVYRISRPDSSLLVRMIPADAARRSSVVKVTPLVTSEPGFITYTCGIAVSEDQRTLAIRYADSDSYTLGWPHARNHQVVVYHDFGEQGAGAPVVIRLATQNRTAAYAADSTSHRILAFSPDGKFLLVGTRQNQVSEAELYDTFTGKLVHNWTADAPLGIAPTAVPHADYFADASFGGKAIRLVEWSTGSVLREISTSGPVAWFCATSDGREIVASIGRREIERYGLESGKRIDKLESNLLPLAWAPGKNVFVAFSVEAATWNRGSVVMAKSATGKICTILQKNANLGCPAKFTPDGQALAYTDENGGYEFARLVRSLDPESADRDLSVPRGISNGLVDSVLTPIDSATSATPNLVDADNPKRLAELMGTYASVQGTVVDVRSTVGGNRLNIFLNSKTSTFQLHVPPEAMSEFSNRFKGDAIGGLNGKKVIASGILVAFGKRIEIVLNEPSQLRVVASDHESGSEKGSAATDKSRSESK